MRPIEPSVDPNRTLDHEVKAQPETVSLSQEASIGATVPYVATPPAGAPSIPGYAITQMIAKGGMGRVWGAIDQKFDREVAIKTLLPLANAERFAAEAQITAKLPHPGIPPVHDLGTLADGSPFLAMKLIRGRTLAQLLASPAPGRPELPRFVQMFEQIAQAVGFAHSRGIIHRDLKPLNVMVGEFGEVQVMDWGLAKDEGERLKDEQQQGADTDRLAATRGGALLGQKKHADAEPHLLKGYEGLKTRAATIPKGGETRIPEALERLIELYTATNKPDEARKYQDLRAKYP